MIAYNSSEIKAQKQPAQVIIIIIFLANFLLVSHR